MANNFEYSQFFATSLDEAYRRLAITSVLDNMPDDTKYNKQTGKFYVPTLEVQGLGDYDRAKGFPMGDATLKYKDYELSYDRGRMFEVDALDNIETAGIAYGKLAETFMKNYVVPEMDARRFASYVSKADPSQVITETFTDGKSIMKSLSDNSAILDDKEVSLTDRYLFINPTALRMVQNLETYASKEVLGSFASVTTVPTARFKSAIKLFDGFTDTKGGYEADATGKSINYFIVQKDAIIQFAKHLAMKIVTPEANNDKDAWKFGYRIAGVDEIYSQKTVGIFASLSA